MTELNHHNDPTGLIQSAKTANTTLYLGSISVVDSLLRDFVSSIMSRFERVGNGELTPQDASERDKALCKQYASIFLGQQQGYQAIPDWNASALPMYVRIKMKNAIQTQEDNNSVLAQCFALLVHTIYNQIRKQASAEKMSEAINEHIKSLTWLLIGLEEGEDNKPKDDVYVKPHNYDTGNHAQAMPYHHPKPDEKGKPVLIKKPTHPSAPSTWYNPDAVATFVPDGDVPLAINNISIRRWRDHPETVGGWDYVDGINDDLIEPPFQLTKGKKAAGVVIEEPDGRVWIIHPSNQFGGYQSSFPKGTAEPELSLQATALKEAFEETGLEVKITGFIGDFQRTTSVVRMYRAKRISGDPTQCGWETQAVSLCPKNLLYDYLNMWTDHAIAEAIGAVKLSK